MDVKSFVLGYNAGASKRGGNVTQAELEAAIKEVVPEWALDEEPPKDAVTSVNNKTGAVSLSAEDVGARPASWTPTAADVGAEINGTASALLSLHNINVESHGDIRIEIEAHRAEVNALLNSDDETLNETKEIVAYIKSNKTLIDAITAAKVNVSDIVNNLATNRSDRPLSAAQGVFLKALIDALTTTVDGKTNSEQVRAAISSALTSYLTAAKAAELYQPKGDYATTTALEQGLKTKQPLGNYLTQHQSLAHLLPKNQGAENAGKIMAVATDGSVTYIPISDLGVSGDLVGNFADDGSIVLITPLDVGVYDLYTEDGRLYGKMTVEAAKAKYTVTFMADGAVVAVVDYAAGDSTISEPAVPHKEGYTGAWEAYDLSLGGDIIVHALYTETVVEPAFVNLIDEAGYTVGKRISDSADGGEVTSGASKLVLTGHIPVGQYGDVFHVRGVDSLIAPLPSGTADQAGLRSCWDANKVYIDNTVKSYPRELAGTDENGDLTLTYTEAWEVPEGTAYIRMQFYDADGSVPSLIVTRNQLIPKS